MFERECQRILKGFTLLIKLNRILLNDGLEGCCHGYMYARPEGELFLQTVCSQMSWFSHHLHLTENSHDYDVCASTLLLNNRFFKNSFQFRIPKNIKTNLKFRILTMGVCGQKDGDEAAKINAEPNPIYVKSI